LPQSETPDVTRRRALLTDRERELLKDEDAENQRYVAISRVRTKIKEELTEDLEILQQHHPDLYDELLKVVCEDAQQPAVPSEDPSRRNAAPSPGPRPDEVSDTDSAEERDLEARMEEELATLDIKGRGAETKEVRREAIRHAWEELRDRGEATTQEISNTAFDEYADHPRFGYSASENHYRSYTFWDSCARDVMKELPGVVAPPQRGNTWRFDDDD